jgi:hypothetical protein
MKSGEKQKLKTSRKTNGIENLKTAEPKSARGFFIGTDHLYLPPIITDSSQDSILYGNKYHFL